MTDWTRIRKDYPICENNVYFQSAGMSPLSTPVFQAILNEYIKIHETGDISWHQDVKVFHELCRDFAALIHTEPENLTFVQNTSTIMSILALSFVHQGPKEFNIVSMQDEFPATSVPFEYQNIPMRYVQPQNSQYPLASILDKTDDKTLAVVTSYVQYSTGFRQNLETLGQELHKKNILFIVNATQAIPYFPLNVKSMNIDALAASLHKWGGAGHVGSLYFTSPEFRKKFKPPFAGWLSVVPDKGFVHTGKNVPLQLHDSARRYELGTMNLQTLKALRSSLDYFKVIGWENIRTRLFELTDYLIAKLKKLPISIISPTKSYDERSAIISFTTQLDNQQIVTQLERKRIYVSFRAGNIRVAVNIFNNHQDIDLLIKELAELV